MRILKIAPLLALCVSLVTVASAQAAVEPTCPAGQHFVFNPELGSGRCVLEGNWYTNGKLQDAPPSFLEGTAILQDVAFGEFSCEVLADATLNGGNVTLGYLADMPCTGGLRESNPAYLSVAPPPTVVCGNETNPCTDYVARRGGLPPSITFQPVWVELEPGLKSLFFWSTKEVKLWLEVPSKNVRFELHGILVLSGINGQKSGLTPSRLDFANELLAGLPTLEGPMGHDVLKGTDWIEGRQMQLETWK